MVEKRDPAEVAIDKAKPILSRLTFGSLVGYCSGMATQRIAKTAAFLIGVSFIAIQVSVSSGVVTMDWNKLQLHCHKILDVSGDEQLNADDLKIYWQRVRRILTKNLPSAGGFSFGFLYGLRYG
jgi:uncharacterized membrane protein (Fun14 family)